MSNSQEDKTIFKTPNSDCPACQKKILHNEHEWKTYHPLAGTGHSREHGSPLKKNVTENK